MNPVDHPHGGGRTMSYWKPRPLTPWGKPALGIKTRKRKIRAIYLLFVHDKNKIINLLWDDQYQKDLI